jgi:hypothetical protein
MMKEKGEEATKEKSKSKTSKLSGFQQRFFEKQEDG